MKTKMEKINLLVSCLVGCLLFTGCNAIQNNNQPIESKSYKNCNSNLSVKLDIEKNGVKLDHLSTVSSGKNDFSLASSIQDSKGSSHIIMFQFSAKNISKIAHNVYSMNYSVSMKIPFSVGKSLRYSEVGNNSSINIILGQQACIYANKDYKVKILVTIE